MYVAVTGSPKGGGPHDNAADGIAVVDLRRAKVVRVIEAGRDPEAFDITADGRRLFVANEESAEVSEIDVASGKTLRRVSVGAEPEGVTVVAERVYVACEAANRVDVIEDGRVVRSIPAPGRPRAIAVRDAQGFITEENAGELAVFDVDTNETRARVPTGPNARPMGIAAALHGGEIYVSNGRAGSIAVVDVKSRAVIGSIDRVGGRPWGLTAVGEKLYVATGDDVAIVSIPQRAVLSHVSVGKGAWGAATLTRR